MTVAIALLVMGFAQGGLLFVIGPFLKVIVSLDQGQNSILVKELLPKQAFGYVYPSLLNFQIPVKGIVYGIPIALVIIGVIRSVAMYLYQRAQAAIALTVAKNTRTTLFTALMHHKYSELSQKSAAYWMSLIMNDVLYLQMRFSEIMTVLLKDSVMILSCLVAMFVIHWQTGVFLLLVSPIAAYGLGRAGKRISFFANYWQRELSKIATFVLDIRQRFVFIRAQGGEQREYERFKERNENYYRSIRKSILLRSAFAPMIEWVGFVLFAFFVYIVAVGKWGEDFSSATMIQFFAALGLLIKPLKEMGEQLAGFNEVKGSLSECKEVLLRNHSDHTVRHRINRRGSLPNGVIEAVKVSYGESGGIEAGKLEFSPGKTIAVIGPSGGGKSTLIKCLCGLVDAQLWRGTLSQPEFSAHTSLVSQRPFLFQDTIRANLSYGLESPPSDDLLREHLQALHLLGLNLNDKFDPISQNLSGGQIQRLVILRALLRQREILLLDEATSALDTDVEKQILTELFNLAKKKGIMFIVVTHRLSFLEQFDEVWFVEGGKLIVKGSHSELLENNRYREFVEAGT